MAPRLLNLGTLVPETPCYVFYATRHQVYCRFGKDDMAFASILIWYCTYEQIHTQHTRRSNRLTPIYINTTCYVLKERNYIYYIELITHCYQKFEDTQKIHTPHTEENDIGKDKLLWK